MWQSRWVAIADAAVIAGVVVITDGVDITDAVITDAVIADAVITGAVIADAESLNGHRRCCGHHRCAVFTDLAITHVAITGTILGAWSQLPRNR
jgi:hypothetical protein